MWFLMSVRACLANLTEGSLNESCTVQQIHLKAPAENMQETKIFDHVVTHIVERERGQVVQVINNDGYMEVL